MIGFEVFPDTGEPWKVTATSRDVLHWERVNKGKTFQGLMDSMAFVDLFHLAFLASRRQGLIDASVTLREFEGSHEITPTADEDGAEPDELDPTKPAH